MRTFINKYKMCYNLDRGDFMKALITGASSGIGKEIAKYLNKKGMELILVSRDKTRLNELADKLDGSVEAISMDLSDESNCYRLFDMLSNQDIDIVVNNAGFGLIGEFDKTDLSKEIEMINLNIKTVHILTKLFLEDMVKKDRGYILNVASSAAFQPGPLMATYYSTKAYVLRLTTSIYEELRRKKSRVAVSVLCPGPVNTNFSNVAKVEFTMKSLSSSYVAKYAIDQMFKKKLIIIPGFKMKLIYLLGKVTPTKLIARIAYNIQKKKKSKI